MSSDLSFNHYSALNVNDVYTPINFDNDGCLDSRVDPTFDNAFQQQDRDFQQQAKGMSYLATPESMLNGHAQLSMPQTPYFPASPYHGANQHTSANRYAPTNLPQTALSFGDTLGMPSMGFQGAHDFGLGTPFSEGAHGGLPSFSPSSSPMDYLGKQTTFDPDIAASFQSPQNFMGMQQFQQSSGEQHAEEQQQQQQQQREEGEDAGDEDTQELCYARLIHQCLSEARNNTLPLQKIYSWIEANSCKAKETSTRALHNSVRHNLSMNRAFERVVPDPTNRQQEKHCWRLASKALAPNSLLPTTHYREPPKHAKSAAAKRRGDQQPAVARQISGAKGGKATRRLRLQQQQQAARSAVPSVRGEEMGRRQRQMPLPEFIPDSRAYVTEMPYWAPVASQAQQQQQQSWGMSTPYPTPAMGAQHIEHDQWFSAGFTGEHESAAAASGNVEPDMDILGPVHNFNMH